MKLFFCIFGIKRCGKLYRKMIFKRLNVKFFV
ncbi:hypothetical protein Q787_10575 [Ornithobacterium rhinotracheale H06-030791]|nr:hypothetical protein Q785_10980 [Ornithobacterium rhinotracheale ORT-UMN 88]KGB66409.1 hypothetical protein Q787_10575 [Ornithobacterium rhinotracheale H06-030791]